MMKWIRRMIGPARQASQIEESRDRVASISGAKLREAIDANARTTDTLRGLVREMQIRTRPIGGRDAELNRS